MCSGGTVPWGGGVRGLEACQANSGANRGTGQCHYIEKAGRVGVSPGPSAPGAGLLGGRAGQPFGVHGGGHAQGTFMVKPEEVPPPPHPFDYSSITSGLHLSVFN